MKVVINRCFGGFSLSDAALRLLCERKGVDYNDEEARSELEWQVANINDTIKDPSEVLRDDADLVAIVEAMGANADGPYARLHVVEIPDGIEWEIAEYDGLEHVAEKHRTWR